MKKFLALISVFSIKNFLNATDVDISNLEKRDVFLALYRAAQPRDSVSGPYTTISNEGLDWFLGVARQYNAQGRLIFDFVHNKALKVDITENVFDSSRYNEYNGQNVAEEAIASLRSKE